MTPAAAPAPGLVRVGWWEWILLPGTSPHPLRAKCDTGAAVSALHAEDIAVVHRGELEVVSFRLVPGGDPVELPVKSTLSVRSSNGESQGRPLVLMPVTLAGYTFAIEVTLTDRTPMNYPMLLGRSALAGRFLVDPSTCHLHRKPRGRAR